MYTQDYKSESLDPVTVLVYRQEPFEFMTKSEYEVSLYADYTPGKSKLKSLQDTLERILSVDKITKKI